MVKSEARGHDGKGRRSKYRSFVNEKTDSGYAKAVDRFFSGFADKNRMFRVVSKEEEREAIDRLKDDRPSLEKYLMTHNIFLAINLASHYSRMYSDYDDLISNAMFGLKEAARKFDVTKGTRFNTYATCWILKYIKYPFYNDTYNKRIVANTSVYLDSADFSKEDREDGKRPCYSAFSESVDPTYVHRIPMSSNPADDVERREADCARSRLIDTITASVNASSLSRTDKRIYSELFVSGKDVRDASADMGVSMMTVIKGKRRIAKYISKNFSELRSLVE